MLVALRPISFKILSNHEGLFNLKNKRTKANAYKPLKALVLKQHLITTIKISKMREIPPPSLIFFTILYFAIPAPKEKLNNKLKYSIGIYANW